jgi:hypothetical protein
MIRTLFHQFKSLALELFNEMVDELESFLVLTSSLVYLKLIIGGDMLDGKRWEEFVEIYLPHLNKFEFCFEELLQILN